MNARIANEGYLMTDIIEEQIDLLSSKDKCLCVFTSNSYATYGGLSKGDITNIMRKYNFKDYTSIHIMQYISYRVLSNSISHRCFDRKLIDILNKVPIDKNAFVGDVLQVLSHQCSIYQKNENKLVLFIITDPFYYSNKFLKDHPNIIIDVSITNLATSSKITLFNFLKKLSEYFKERNNFKIMSTKLPPGTIKYGKDLKVNLFHISPISNITKLVPKKTIKPLRGENVRIPRISAAGSIDACFRAIGLNISDNEKVKYFVYKLKITPNTRIIKPSKELVPDSDITGEYWVLDAVEVECLGYITVSYNHITAKYDFDTSNMKNGGGIL